LFEFPVVDKLNSAAARVAIMKPAQAQGVEITEPALREILDQARGYPYFLQEWGKHAWDTASASPIGLRDVQQAAKSAVAALDESFFRVRFDRLTPNERRYLRAMAELGPGPHRSGGHRRLLACQGKLTKPHARQADRKGDDLEPEPR
jgi:hypothetical protein